MDESTQLQGFQKDLVQSSQLFEEKIREILAVRRVWDSLKHIRDVRKVFGTILDTILDETNAENCSIMLLNHETGELAVKAAKGQKDTAAGYYHTVNSAWHSFRSGEGVAGWVVQHGKSISIPDVAGDSRFVSVSGSGSAGLIASLICVPLVCDGEVVGVVNLSHPRPRAFAAEDERLMAIIADQVAVALNSVQIFDEMRQFNLLLEEEVARATEALRRSNLELKDEIAERQRAEEALREREKELKELNVSLEERVRQRTLELQALYERMEGLVEHLPEGVFLLDDGRRLILANPSAREALKDLAEVEVGSPVSRIGGRTLEELLTPSPNGLAHEVVIEGHRIFEIKARPISEGRKEGGWVLVMREVTREREMQERAQQQDRLAVVGQLAAGVAHDFNNLLMGIIGFAELLETQEDIPEPAKGHLRSIVSQGQRGAQLVRQILDFSRKTFVERRSLDMALFLKEMVRLLERTLPETIRVVTEFSAEGGIVKANATQLQQVITNLAVNARDAMPDGGEIRIKLSRLRASPRKRLPLPEMKPGEWVVWTVSDTGMGMSPDVLEHIFEPFFTTKPVGEGSGLGLAQVYGIVKQHGGEITVESEAGEGATFTVYLPLITRAEAPPRRFNVDFQKGQGETVLVVEDEAVVLQVVKTMLEGLNYRVLTATNGEEAQTVYDSYCDEIALVLTDVVMPVMGGVELFRALKERDPGVRVVMMTGYPLREGDDVQLIQGVAGRLEKPTRLKQVAQVVSEALKRG